jgi:hypothetical protein
MTVSVETETQPDKGTQDRAKDNEESHLTEDEKDWIRSISDQKYGE